MAPPRRSIRDRFMDMVSPEPNTGCWLWSGSISTHGYGHMNKPGRSGKGRLAAHRVGYELFRGAIPAGLTIDHLCRVRTCVNPDHLEAVTIEVNQLRAVGTPAWNTLKTHCANGHAFDDINTRLWKGMRACRICQRAASARYKARVKVQMSERRHQ